jgi:hypothetical protein
MLRSGTRARESHPGRAQRTRVEVDHTVEFYHPDVVIEQKDPMVQKEPGRVRQRVLNDDPDRIVSVLRTNPNSWYVIATGPSERLSTLSQTGYRIRRGDYRAFGPKRNPGGRFEVVTSSDPSVVREEPVELFARWVPDAPVSTNTQSR